MEHDLHADMCSTASAEGKVGARIFRNIAIRLHVICLALLHADQQFYREIFFVVFKKKFVSERSSLPAWLW